MHHHGFQSQKSNIKASNKTLAIYAKLNNLLHTKGWNGYEEFLPVVMNSTASLSLKQQNFFQQCYHLQQANKAINPDTGKLSQFSTLLKSSDGNTGKKFAVRKLVDLHKAAHHLVQKELTQCILFVLTF